MVVREFQTEAVSDLQFLSQKDMTYILRLDMRQDYYWDNFVM